ncbi:hypothetical protein SAMIE_1005840 [Sphingobium amiense]|uniref:Uncharacterized protein n=1 Tax=Sphingobium amiense TaxID=135719 RepID=A0A494VXG9_9SPHN|nr:hypothetical protein SAMIE_1005840 [Sphingobium amiense]
MSEMLGGAMGFSERESGAVTASHAIATISSASITATIHPTIRSLFRHGVGGAKALGGPSPKARGGMIGSAGCESAIGSVMLYYSHHTVKHVPRRDSGILTNISSGPNGK